MSADLPASVWREIEQAAVNRPYASGGPYGKYISLGVLRTILKKSRRSNDQNALLWALYSDAIKQGGESLGGWTTADIHEFMLGEYHGWTVHEAFGQKRKKPVARSSRMSKMEFSDFVAFVVQTFAEKAGIVLELPDDARSTAA